MAEQLDNSINSLVAEQVEVQMHRLHQDILENWGEIWPTLNHRLPFLTLALKNLEERKADFKNDSHEVWAQLIRWMQDIRKWDNKPTKCRINNRTSIVSTISTNIRENRRNRKGIQELDGDSARFCKKCLDIPRRGNTKSSQNSLDISKSRKPLFRFYTKRGDHKYQRGRRILSRRAQSWGTI